MNFKFDIHKLILLLSIVLICVIIKTSKSDYTHSDPHLALLTSQALIEKGTINLESYRNSVPENEFSGKWQYTVNEKKNETFYFYPLGTSFLSVPFVLAAKVFGMNMIKSEDDSKLQFIITSLLCIFIFLLLYTIALCFLNKWSSLFLTLLLFLGTTFISTLGTALWSFDYAIIFILLALREIINAENGNEPRVVLIAIYLSLAWVCRPSALSFITVAGLWILIKHRKLLLKYIAGSVVLLLPFFIFTYFTYGKILPDYYNPLSWKHIFLGSFYFNVLAYIWFGPMRGLFTFTPVLLLSFFGFFKKQLRTNTFYKLLFLHFIIHTIMLVNQPDWYGGWCFGPRLFTDVLPSLCIMIFMVIKESQPMPFLKSSLIGVLLCLGILIHTAQGMYNKNVHSWNDAPDVSEGLGFLCWNWRFPQFLATEGNNKLKTKVYNLEHEVSVLITKTPNTAALLFGRPDQYIKEYLNEWNSAHSKATGNEVYNNIEEIKLKNRKEFWFPAYLTDEVKKNKSCSIVFPEGEFLKNDLLKAVFK